MKQNTEKWAIEVTKDNVQELVDAGFDNAKVALERYEEVRAVVYSDNCYSSFGHYLYHEVQNYQLITIKQLTVAEGGDLKDKSFNLAQMPNRSTND